MNENYNEPVITRDSWNFGGIGQPPPNDGSGDEDSVTSVPTGSRRGRGILTPPDPRRDLLVIVSSVIVIVLGLVLIGVL
jgi:hypothetical protein